MKVLALCRLFSGFAASLENGKWEPEGAPAIARVLEGLQQNSGIELQSVFAVKDFGIVERFGKTRQDHLPEIGNYVVWPAFRIGIRKLDVLLTEIDHACRALLLCWRMKPDVVYATYGQIGAATAISRLGLAPVVLRMMGIFPHHRALLKRKFSLGLWMLSSPFAHVVCTQEGSGSETVVPKLVSDGIPQTIALNGVDMPAVSRAQIDDLRKRHGLGARPMVLFVGRLEDYKGCLEFLDAAIGYLERRPGSADFVLVGDGSCFDELRCRIERGGVAENVHLAGAMPHSEVPVWLSAADIYVSLNRHGNLSNANLEALAMGACLLIPSENPVGDVDVHTAEILPPDVVIRYDRDDQVASLVRAMLDLLATPARVARLKSETRKLARKLLVPWRTRVEKEIEILKTAAGVSA